MHTFWGPWAAGLLPCLFADAACYFLFSIFSRMYDITILLRSSGEKMSERTGSHCVCMLLTESVMILIAWFNYTLTLLQLALQIQTGAQYSPTLSTKPSVEVLKTFGPQPQLFSSSLTITILLYCLFFIATLYYL